MDVNLNPQLRLLRGEFYLKKASRWGSWEVLNRPNPLNERPHFVRRKKADLHGAGLELLTRYLRRIEFNKLVRKYLTEVLPVGDFGSVTLLRTILGLLVVGGRRLRHIAFMKEDPIFERFCGL